MASSHCYRNAFFGLLLALQGVLCTLASEAEVPLVEVMQGEVKGSRMLTYAGREVAAYRGIPYAEPPVGDLRFREPKPVNAWSGILDATSEAPVCIQKDIIFFENPPVVGVEDCLYLNVYVPLDILTSIKKSEEEGKLWKKIPVMVYIHGGGWLGGSGGSHNFGPQLLLDKDVILVTMNYRLSAFGFLSTGDNAAPGNNGLKDQALALKWVNSNIGAFGGDHDKITIFGQSAGGASVHYHILSPMSKGLFQNGVSHSGNALASWAMARDAPTHAKTLAGYVNCPTNEGSQAMVDCLRNKDAVEIARQFDKFLRWDIDPLIVFTPTIEKEGNDEMPFITEHPYQLMKKGEFNPVKWMAGLTSEDGAMRTAVILSNERRAKEINDEFIDRIGPLALRFEETASDPKEVARKIRQFYFGEKDIDIHTHKTLTDVFNDRMFINGIKQSFELMKSVPDVPFTGYYYMFSHRGKYSLLDDKQVINKSTNTPVDWGVGHCDELMYLLPMKDFAKAPLVGDDLHMSNIMRKMWTDFADTGNPTPAIDDLIPVNWEPVEPNRIPCLNIGVPSKKMQIQPMSEEYLARYKFWESLNLKENQHYVPEKIKDEL
ncbi:juvenile hormone esterase-like [Ischnura elegans]|uniref:juvenile hormone esterase-like n=1 Tax=Ischnura elegans TaxID=197161 RepID=UPI001ED88853|nr:juvenile hormone esterase-like [Ischnura elegans]